MKQLEMQKVLTILQADESGLLELAKISGREIFGFYRSCELRGLNLIGQDLQGLNFDFADLTSSNLDGAKFDVGALNNAIVDDRYAIMKDDYGCYIEDLSLKHIQNLSCYVKFRKEVVDDITDRLRVHGINYAELGKYCGISGSTLRKIRRQVPVAITSAISFSSGLSRLQKDIGAGFISDIEGQIRQPFLAISDYGAGQEERKIGRGEILELVDLIDQVNVEMYPSLAEDGKIFPWSAKPATFRWMKSYYLDGSLERVFGVNVNQFISEGRILFPEYVPVADK